MLAGPALPADTPQVSPRQLAAAQKASATRHASATGRGSEASIPAAHAEVPMIRQVAPESSSTSLQPSTSGASIIRSLCSYCAGLAKPNCPCPYWGSCQAVKPVESRTHSHKEALSSTWATKQQLKAYSIYQARCTAWSASSRHC